MSITYVIVNAGGSNHPANAPAFERREGERLEFPGGGRLDEFRGEEGEGRSFGFELVMILGSIRIL